MGACHTLSQAVCWKHIFSEVSCLFFLCEFSPQYKYSPTNDLFLSLLCTQYAHISPQDVFIYTYYIPISLYRMRQYFTTARNFGHRRRFCDCTFAMLSELFWPSVWTSIWWAEEPRRHIKESCTLCVKAALFLYDYIRCENQLENEISFGVLSFSFPSK